MREVNVQPRLESQAESVLTLLKPKSWLTKIEFIKHLVQGSNVLISILGEQSGGKSTFANILLATLAPKVNAVVVTASPLFELHSILSQIGQALNHQGEMRLENFIAECQAEKTPTLIILDDAHFLPQSFIVEILDAIAQQEHAYFHVCLVSNFSLALSLNKMSESYPNLIHSVELGPLTEQETENILRDKFQAQPGMQAQLTQERIKQFYELTEGSIVGINTQMGAFFNQQLPKKRKPWLFATVAAVIAAMAVGVTYILNNVVSTSLPSVEVIAQLPQPIPTTSPTEAALPSEIPAFTFASVRQELQATSLRKIDFLIPDDEHASADDTLVVMDKVLVIPKVVGNKATKPAGAPKVAAVVTPKKVVANPQKSVVKIPAGTFTIQLLASHSKSELEHFAKVHHIKGKMKILRSQSRNVNWYVLTYGEYKQRGLAKQAVNHLPSVLAKLNPWVRQLSELKSTG